MDANVTDANAAVTQASSSDFVGSLTGLPAETTVSGVTTSSTGNNFIPYYKETIAKKRNIYIPRRA